MTNNQIRKSVVGLKTFVCFAEQTAAAESEQERLQANRMCVCVRKSSDLPPWEKLRKRENGGIVHLSDTASPRCCCSFNTAEVWQLADALQPPEGPRCHLPKWIYCLKLGSLCVSRQGPRVFHSTQRSQCFFPEESFV